MGDYSPANAAGAVPFTLQASATITGGRLVMISGAGTVAHADAVAGHKAIGVAAQDAVSGQKVTVWPLPGLVHELTISASVAFTAGDDVVAAAGGLANKGTLATDAASGLLVGVAVNSKTGDGANGVTVRVVGA